MNESLAENYNEEINTNSRPDELESNFSVTPTILPIFDNDENDITNDIEDSINHLDVIDMNRIDNVMCSYIWNDFKQQYKPFINSLFKLTNVDSQYYFSIPENREIVYNYINQHLKGVKLLKFRPIGSSYIFFTLKRINDHKIINKLDFFEKQLMQFKDRLDIIQEQITKIYNAPGMPGYIDALNNFNEIMSEINRNN
ncbi:MAG: hypothetical protein EBX50_14985 [Chitinophagia bacterium]|nr:hypothetical protein [Chitinophagia bacterium]